MMTHVQNTYRQHEVTLTVHNVDNEDIFPDLSSDRNNLEAINFRERFKKTYDPADIPIVDIGYVSSRAGAGKTHAYLNIALNRSTVRKNTIICVPTVALAEELRWSIKAKNPACRVILFHSQDGTDEAVSTRTLAYLSEKKRAGDILIITHQTFLNLPYFPAKADWKLLVDENIPIFLCKTINLHENHGLITNNVDIIDAGPVHGKINIAN